MSKEYLAHVINELSKPLPFKWKLQSYTKDKSKALCVAYIDARDVTKRLNEVCYHGWHKEHFPIGNDTYCKIGLIMPDASVIWRSDVGESENETERAKTSASDSFKRAAVHFGVGMFLYELETVKLPTKQNGNFYDVVDEAGNKIWDLTDHINKMKSKPKTKPKPPTSTDTPKPNPELKVGTKNYEHTVKRMKEGVTLDIIKKHFTITEEVEKQLNIDAKA